MISDGDVQGSVAAKTSNNTFDELCLSWPTGLETNHMPTDMNRPLQIPLDDYLVKPDHSE